ncbi:MAG: 2-amino-4-hydroxy-6-hydroxymethyldihydropteridine diphosphokinase [Desulfovibrionaceae bacterium]|nr:2-amino-4-hydroxy-6-hydroxymethyldihydropteridine diphosphokinase [Desulfovibrionaceae bacterium]
MFTPAFIGLSANLPSSYGPPEKNLDMALKILGEKSKIAAVSPRYLTSPLGVKEQMPDFLNQVIKIYWADTARGLLDMLLETENRLERVRPGDKDGPAARTIDLDLLLFGKEIWNLPELTVPHPRMFGRAFVLVPLLDIWSEDDEIPGQGRAAEFLQNALNALTWSLDNRYIVQDN